MIFLYRERPSWIVPEERTALRERRTADMAQIESLVVARVRVFSGGLRRKR
jgi:hypothetical protein